MLVGMDSMPHHPFNNRQRRAPVFNIPYTVTSALSRLSAAGFEGYVVGGCVRDMLMGREIHDWDITTNALPSEVHEVFSDNKVFDTGIAHGTVSVLTGGGVLEITTYRVDGEYTDNRHPDSVTFTRSLREDLSRRDFTMNAIAYSPADGLVDPFGGQEDIKRGVIRCVGDASKRFDEDALRILRALRFASMLGFAIEENTAAASRQKSQLLKNVSAERINVELTKLLCGGGAGEVLRNYRDILAVAIPQLAPMFDFDQQNRHHIYDVWTHTIITVEALPSITELRWAALFHDIGKPASFTMDEHGEGHYYGHAEAGAQIANEVMHALKFDNATRERVFLLVKFHDTTVGTDEKRVKRLLGRFGEEFVRQLLLLKRADNLAQSEKYRERQQLITKAEALIDEIIARKDCVSLKDLAVNGRDMMELGFEGKAIGEALQTLLDAVIDGLVPNEKTALIEYVKP